MNSYRKMYFDRLKNILKKKNINFLDLTEVLKSSGKKLEEMLVDGIHPGAEGHRLICENLVKLIHPLL